MTAPAIRLAASNPATVNNSLASLAQQFGVELRVSRDMKAKYDGKGVFLGYEPTGGNLVVVQGNPAGIAELRERMEGAFAAPTDEQMEMWLAELDLIAPRRPSSTNDDDLRMQAYCSRLAAYPADVVREALLVHTWRFFPSWAELKDVCDELTAHRVAVRDELERLAAAHRERNLRAVALPQPPAEPDEEAAAKRRAEADRIAGDVLASLTAKVAQEDAAARAARQAAADSYAARRGKPEPSPEA